MYCIGFCLQKRFFTLLLLCGMIKTSFKFFLQQDIHSCISQFIKSATSRPPPYGVGHYANSRAIYGFDVMLEWGLDSNTGMGMLNSS